MNAKYEGSNMEHGLIAHIREKYGVVCDTDSYKLGHHAQYPAGATRMCSYIESRGGKYDEVLFFGLQFIIKEYFMQKLTHAQVDNMIAFEKMHMMENITGDLEIALRRVVDVYGGNIPIRIRAVEEGHIVPIKNVMVTVETTAPDNKIFSLVSYFETKIMRLWSPTTVATESYNIRKIILTALEESADDPLAEIPFKLHDFGGRGVGGMETAAFAGAGHLVSFQGSDTVIAILAANEGYNCEMSAFSIPATEHSTTTMHGPDGEEGLLENMFSNYAKPGAIFATVIDSYEWLKFVRELAPKFKERLKESGATWVFRPDSGDPVATPIKVVEELGRIFGYVMNTKGYKVLNNVRVIQGDGIDKNDVQHILRQLLRGGWSATNMIFGMGGGLLQKNNRDTQKMTMKCCAVEIDGEWQDVYKDPAVYNADWTLSKEKSFKISKRGRLELLHYEDNNDWVTVKEGLAKKMLGRESVWKSMLETVYEDGVLVKDLTMDQVRRNAGII